MPKLKGVMCLLALYNKYAILILALALALTGCGGGKAVKKKEAAVQQQPKIVDTKQAEAAAKISPEAKRDFDRALDAMQDGDEARAEALLRRVSVVNPDLSGPYVNLGLLKFRAGQLEAAEQQFKKALEVNPRSAVSYNHMGIISRGRGEFKEARTFYQKALEIDPDYAYAHLNYGILLDLYLGELEQALDHYERFQELSENEDKEVKKWIVDLQRRIKSSN